MCVDVAKHIGKLIQERAGNGEDLSLAAQNQGYDPKKDQLCEL